MIVRSYDPADAPILDSIQRFNRNRFVRLDLDRIVVAGPVGVPVGSLVWRPTGFIHELQFARDTLANRPIADALIRHATSDALLRPWPISQAVFLIDPSNSAMLRYVRALPGVVEDTGIMFIIQLEGDQCCK